MSEQGFQRSVSDGVKMGSGWSLGGFTGAGYDRGRPLVNQIMWFLVQKAAWQRWWFPARLRPAVLRLFGAEVGSGVLIRHGVRIHWPWKLNVGSDVWIGEDAWIINLESVTIENDVCVSQGAVLCTGSHDRRSPTFEFDNAPIVLRAGCWIAVRAIVLRGVTVNSRAIVGAGAVAASDVAQDQALVASPTVINIAGRPGDSTDLRR